MSEGLREKIENLKRPHEQLSPNLKFIRVCINEVIDNILALSELQQVIEDAERYREIEFYGADDKASQIKEWKEKAEQFDKMFEGLVVVKKCKKICQDAVALAKYNGGVNTNYCPDCNGTGTVSRPLTEEEKGEVFIYRVSKNDMVLGCIDRLFLPSGAKVVRGK